MTYENLVKEVKKVVKVIDASIIKEHLAVEFDIEGNGEGAFYVEFKENIVEVEPYEYYDHDFRVRCSADIAIKLLKGELNPISEVDKGTIVVEGTNGKLILLENYLKAEVKEKKTTKRTTKSAGKKPVPKKVTKKPASKTK
ncbi:MAG: SCP2 sterol-binding domain-containing protein [Eubacteriales bacterium]|nr:SCP2 sterol-binding domain-containing protein [Eubacteriales bacterium]